MRNTAIESSLDKKMKPRYEGPKIVVRRNKGGSYILAELTGAVFQQKIAKFRVIPYFARKNIGISKDILKELDIEEAMLDKIEEQPDMDESRYEYQIGRDYLGDDFTMKGQGNLLDHSDSEDSDKDNEEDNIED
jgi:hypothetical protein